MRTDEPSTETAVSYRVIQQVAAATGTDPLDLDPLYETIDPEALDAVFDTATPPEASVTFTLADCEVTVYGSGEISVTPPDAAVDCSTSD